MDSNQLRRLYIQFFQKNQHKLFSSESLVCVDQSLLFTSAGMNQFKPYFLGQKKDVTRAVSCQRCLRTGDIEEVGKTPYHHTFFEMLGNFSFGDYFKQGAIKFAWEFLVQCLKLDSGSLSVSVYEDDREAWNIWKKEIGVSEKNIYKFGQKYNFWPANAVKNGPCGPCGPCSEVFFDHGPKIGCGSDSCNPACSCGRFVEVWNLVFTQFDRQPDGSLQPLPQKNIDTGMGLERVAALLQKKQSNFEIDILLPAVDKVKSIFKVNKVDSEKEKMINSVVDHSRAAAFAVADGVYPSNEERGYVIRKLLRKALWTACLLDYKKPFIHKLAGLFAGLMQEPYPFLKEKLAVVEKVIKAEEEKFLFGLKEAGEKLDLYLQQAKKNKQPVIAADKIFCLYDTYGFPLELAETIAGRENIKLDRCGAEKLMAEQKARSRLKSKFSGRVFQEEPPALSCFKPTLFSGCNLAESEAVVIGIFSCNQKEVDWQAQAVCLEKNQEGIVITDKTIFYPESGGQLCDQGLIITKKGKFRVEHVCKLENAAVYLHRGKVIEGVTEKTKAVLKVDLGRQKALARAHTTTHLLQAALRQVLGSHVSQQGSLVAADRIRFDFTHFSAMTGCQVKQVEELVNRLILEAVSVEEKRDISLEQARKQGALAFFKEKYKSKVRMIGISDYSKELCGGIHLENTSQAGGFAVISESSVSSGVRRIEAVVGDQFYRLFWQKKEQLESLAEKLKSTPDKAEAALEKTLANLKESRELLAKLEKEKNSQIASCLVKDFSQKVGNTGLLVYDFSQKENRFNLDYANLFSLIDSIKQDLNLFFIFLTTKESGKLRFICSCSREFIAKGKGCRDFIEEFKGRLNLKGGGGNHLAQGVIIKKESNFLEKVSNSCKEWIKNAGI